MHPDPSRAAAMMFDTHVVKILLEMVQVLMSAHWVAACGSVPAAKAACRQYKYQGCCDAIEPEWAWHEAVANGAVYRGTHWNHPLSVWARESGANYAYLADGARALAREYEARSGKSHRCEAAARWLSRVKPAAYFAGQYGAGVRRYSDISDAASSGHLPQEFARCTPTPCCCPESHFGKSLVSSYLRYYVKDKAALKHKIRLRRALLGKRKR